VAERNRLWKKKNRSPGYALTLVATSTTTVLRSAEATSSNTPDDKQDQKTPEDVGVMAARQLLAEIERGGCIDRGMEWLVCLLLLLSGEDVGRVRLGPMEPFLYVAYRSCLCGSSSDTDDFPSGSNF
jgi:RNA 3'-terminal phosphate cyclase-like protein